MEKINYMPDVGLGAHGQGIKTLPDFKWQTTKKGLGYHSDEEGRKPRKKSMKLNDYFVMVGYQGEPEPCKVNGVIVPGFEIFVDVADWERGPLSKEEEQNVEPQKENTEWKE